jgi:nitrous oxidase accessory protein
MTVTDRAILNLCAVAALLAVTVTARAEVISVEPGGDHLMVALARAEPGDTLHLARGVHAGPIKIDKTLSLEGAKGARIEGSGEGHVIHISAENVMIRGLLITGSGLELETKDSAIFLDKTAHRARIEGNRLIDNLFGVYDWGAQDAIIRENTIRGRIDVRAAVRGNGVHLWNAKGSRVEFNDITLGRDGIFVTASKKNVFRGNRMREVRYGIHYMYTHDSEIIDNVSIGNHAGYAIMSSHRLKIIGNSSHNDRDHGLLLNYANGSTIEGNKVTNGGNKCVFIYNSNKNAFRRNWFQNCQIGIHFTGGSERNSMTQNAFIGSRTQVKYVGTKWVEWTHEGTGNYWSDNPAFDMDGDGYSDLPYKPNDAVDQVMWRYPLARMLLTSPAVKVLRFAQGQFPGFYPGGVIDTMPMMRPPRLELSNYWERR